MALFTPPFNGSWTPDITFATPGNFAKTLSVAVGHYTKIGSLIIAKFRVETSAFTHTTASGALVMSGLPFTSRNTSTDRWTGDLAWGGITKASYTQVVSHMDPNVATVQFLASGSGQAAGFIVAADTPTGGSLVLRGSITYVAA